MTCLSSYNYLIIFIRQRKRPSTTIAIRLGRVSVIVCFAECQCTPFAGQKENIYLYLTFYENFIDFKRHVFQLTISKRKTLPIMSLLTFTYYMCACVYCVDMHVKLSIVQCCGYGTTYKWRRLNMARHDFSYGMSEI